MGNTTQLDVTEERISPRLIGVWTLAAFTDEREGCEDTHPFGLEPVGFLIYTREGYVSAQLMKPGRSAFQSGDWQHGSPEEYMEAGRGYIAYCGTYEVDEAKRTVTHIPSVALLPNLINSSQVRTVNFSGLNADRLTLRTPPVANAGRVIVTSRLEWRRMVAI